MGELASLLELPEGTVKSRLHHARKQLAEALR
jgi:DNA-directed RNA polymerase specialized sigma24 family protein